MNNRHQLTPFSIASQFDAKTFRYAEKILFIGEKKIAER